MITFEYSALKGNHTSTLITLRSKLCPLHSELIKELPFSNFPSVFEMEEIGNSGETVVCELLFGVFKEA